MHLTLKQQATRPPGDNILQHSSVAPRLGTYSVAFAYELISHATEISSKPGEAHSIHFSSHATSMITSAR